MTFFSAGDDFVVRTLAAVSGRISRLAYLAGLRNSAGEYEHWGLARAHGELPAQKAIGQAHTEAFLKVLRTPLATLSSDYENSQGELQREEGGTVDPLQKAAELMPNDLGGGARSHFSLVVDALYSLLGHQRRDKHRAA